MMWHCGCLRKGLKESECLLITTLKTREVACPLFDLSEFRGLF